MNDSESRKFHGITLLQLCGGGAYGEVYFGRDISGKELAIKIVSKQKLGEEWQRELKGVVNYRQITEDAPELLRIFHVEEDEESFFYTMEAADSASTTEYRPDTLAGRLKKGALPPEEVFGVLSGIFAGIKTIHEAGFAHRDIKPDNILFVKGAPKLGDIGLLSSLAASCTKIAGTMNFLPPELRAADCATSDQLSRKRNDLYAFGKVIYCAVTGQDPDCWPAVPKELPLSLPLKFFLRLAFQLCDKDPAGRVDSIEALQREFAEIKRKLVCGETLRDKLAYHLRRIGAGWRRVRHHLRSFIRIYLSALVLAAAATAGAIWYFRPETPLDIANEKTQQYVNERCGFSLTIPKQWEIISNATIQKYAAELEKQNDRDLSPVEKKRKEFFLSFLKFGIDFIFCDFNGKSSDYIGVQTVPVPGELFRSMPDDELRLNMRQMCQGELALQTEIYEMKRLEINGMPCIFIDFSHDRQQTRIHNYLFTLPDQCCSIALNASGATFPLRQVEFAQVVRTIKFTKKP